MPPRPPPGPPRTVSREEQNPLMRQHSVNSEKDIENKKPIIHSTSSEDDEMDDDVESDSDKSVSSSGRKE